MAGGWGRRATSRIDRSQFGKDELLLSLGSQFNVDFTDYEQWTRRSKPSRPPPDGKKGFMVGRPSKSADSCRHGAQSLSFSEKRRAAKIEEIEKQKSERLKTIELRLRTRRKTRDEYQKRYKELLEENIKLKNSIDMDENCTLDQVKALLRRYEKYRGGIATLNTNFTKEFDGEEEELDKTKSGIELELSVLQKQLEEIDGKLKNRQAELHVLMSYKDKEYPVKAMRIANLHKEIGNLKISNQEDQEELEHIVHTELGKYEKERTKNSYSITKTVTEKSIAVMHPSLKDMALQNMVMNKEIEFHTKEQEELEKINKGLEQEVKRLLRDPKTNSRLQMFPEFFPKYQKCTPDMDVVLDIPTQKWLPI